MKKREYLKKEKKKKVVDTRKTPWTGRLRKGKTKTILVTEEILSEG